MKTSPKPLRAVIYTRVSTGKQAESGLSLTDQVDGTTAAVAARGWTVVHHAQDAGASAKSLKRRPALAEALSMLDRGEADVLVVKTLSRLARSVADFANLMDRAQRRGWGMVCLDLNIDTTTAAGRLVANIFASVAQWEREVIGERTADAHRVRRDRGERVGQEPILSAPVRRRIASEVRKGRSLRSIAQDLNDRGVATAKGGTWHASTVAHVARSVARDASLKAKAKRAA